MIEIIKKSAREQFESYIAERHLEKIDTSSSFDEVYANDFSEYDDIIFAIADGDEFSIRVYPSMSEMRDDNHLIEYLLDVNYISTDYDFFDWLRDDAPFPFSEDDILDSDISYTGSTFEDETEEVDVEEVFEHLYASFKSFDKSQILSWLRDSDYSHEFSRIFENDNVIQFVWNDLCMFTIENISDSMENARFSKSVHYSKDFDSEELQTCEMEIDEDKLSLKEKTPAVTEEEIASIQKFDVNQEFAIKLFKMALNAIGNYDVQIFYTPESGLRFLNGNVIEKGIFIKPNATSDKFVPMSCTKNDKEVDNEFDYNIHYYFGDLDPEQYGVQIKG